MKENIVSSEIMGAIDMLEDSVVIFDSKWRYLYLNKVGWRILGRSKESVLGRNVWKMLPHLKGTEFQKAAYKSMRQRRIMEIEEYYPHRREWYRTKFYPSKNSLFMQMHDITALKEAQQTSEELLGTFEQAMEVYWSDANRERREKSNKTKLS